MDLVTPLSDYEEGNAVVVRGMVTKIKQGEGWSRVEFVDETGKGAAFHNEDTQIEPGQMYFFLIGNNRVARYVTADEIYEALEKGTEDGFVKYLIEEKLFVTEGSYYVVALDRRKTKAGKLMGTLIVANDIGEMRSVLVFPQAFSMAYGKAKPGQTIFATFSKLDDGGLCLKEIG